MPAIDKIRRLSTIVVPNGTGSDGVRQVTSAENNKRTERFLLRVTGQVDLSVAGTALRNRGSILAAIREVGFIDAGGDRVSCDARLLRFIAECWAPSPLPATRMAGFGIQAATLLSETLPIWLSAPRTANLNETKYVEVNKQGNVQVFLVPNKVLGTLLTGTPTGTITNLQATVEQVFDDLLMTPPWFNIYHRTITQDVAGANDSLKIDLRGNRWIRAIAIQQDTNEGEVSDIINSLVLRGDRESIIGDGSVPFLDLQQHQAEEYGGSLTPGYYLHDFARYGRLTAMWNPYQDTNLRIEANVSPSVGNTGSKIRVSLIEYEQTPATMRELPFKF